MGLSLLGSTGETAWVTQLDTAPSCPALRERAEGLPEGQRYRPHTPAMANCALFALFVLDGPLFSFG